MKLHLSDDAALIKSYNPAGICINQHHYRGHVVVSPQGVTPWIFKGWDALSASDLFALVPEHTQIVLFGVGEKYRFLPPKLLADFAQHGIALEGMTSDAACRTYNILVCEGRLVAAILLLL